MFGTAFNRSPSLAIRENFPEPYLIPALDGVVVANEYLVDEKGSDVNLVMGIQPLRAVESVVPFTEIPGREMFRISNLALL